LQKNAFRHILLGKNTAFMAKLLVVDDEEFIRMILKESLEFQGFQVRTATNGLEALEEVSKEEPELILLDIGMPKMDGWEVCRRLKSDPPTSQKYTCA
jgi:two-component system response regulator MprA